jgi:ABC-2 type transport system ATP-binding protein
MSEKLAISVQHVSKDFKLPHEKHSGLKQAVLSFHPGGNNYEMQHALRDVSFDIKKGEFFGIVGRNGSGKSTLLKILAHIYQPTGGKAVVHGKLVPFIELGVGFNQELTGRDNVFLNGALLGFSHKEMTAMYDTIVEFAELEQFMDQKLKNYSSGMQVRLAFSIAIRAESDILLIDEVLAVGDANFQKKSIEVFDELKRAGRTIVFVTHSMDYVREFCDRVAVINDSKLIYIGNPEKGIDLYNKLNFDRDNLRTEAENEKKKDQIERFGNGKARITSYKFYDMHGKQSTKLAAGEEFSAELEIEFHDDVNNPAVGLMFRKNPLENLFGINSLYRGMSFGAKHKGDTLKVKISGTMPLAVGTYYASMSVSDARSASNYSELDNLNNALKINVDGDLAWGVVASSVKMEAEK